MKKFLSILLCVVIVASAFVACSKNGGEDNSTTENPSTTQTITTDEAKIKEADAINLIKSYSAKELGLSDEEMKECSFMVANSGSELDGKFYIKVIATIKTSHKDESGNETFTFDNKGEYYISYNGKKILQKDMKAEEEKFTEMKVKEVPTTASIDESKE